jgi:hypothetical protein
VKKETTLDKKGKHDVNGKQYTKGSRTKCMEKITGEK